jgi:integral membrane protein (TIGR01906 family)
MRFILTISLIIIIAFLPLTIFMNGLFFKYEFNKQDIAASSGFTLSEYIFFNGQVLKYFFNFKKTILIHSQNGELLKDFFTEEELIHMHDVKVILDTVFCLILIAVVLAFIFLRKALDPLHIAKTASIVVMLAFGLILTLVFINFDKTFYKFHELFFTNSFWLLPDTDMLIRMYPENLFEDYAKLWFGSSFSISLIILSIRKRTS